VSVTSGWATLSLVDPDRVLVKYLCLAFMSVKTFR